MNWKEILNPYMSTGEATFYRRFLHILKHFLIVCSATRFLRNSDRIIEKK